MSASDIFGLLPLLITAGGIIVLLLAICIKRNRNVTFKVACTTLIAAFISALYVANTTPYRVGRLLIIDGYSVFFFGLIFLASLTVIFFSRSYLDKKTENEEEYYILLLIATLGANTLVASHHFISLFLGFEILSTSLYALIAYLRQREISTEAGIKYLILAAASSAFLLFGMALIFAVSGTMYFPELTSLLKTGTISAFTASGLGLMSVGIGFKLALVPFHLWASDVYEGAPAPVTALIASVSKTGVFALWLRFVTELNAFQFQPLITVLSIIAAASMLAGNLLALLQNNVKRLLAYSSVAHLGYLMVAFLVGGKMAVEASAFYLVAYTITILGAFGVVSMLSGQERDAASIEDYRGLFRRKPWLAFIFTIMLLSLAGIPLTVGFLGKFYVLMAGVRANLWWLVLILTASSTIGLFYYLRVIAVMVYGREKETPVLYSSSVSLSSLFASAVLSILLIGLGIYPSLLVSLIRLIVKSE